MDFIIDNNTQNNYSLALERITHEYLTEADLCELQLMEASIIDKDTEKKFKKTLDDIIEKVTKAVDKIVEKIQEFLQKALTEIEIKVQQIKLNKKLEELKDILAKKKAKALGTKFNYFDMQRYKTYYTDFINRYTADMKRGLSRDFKNVEEYEKWRVQMEEQLKDFNYKLSDEEQWRLSVTVNSAIELSEKEADNRRKNLKMVEDKGSSLIRDIEKHYKKLDFESSLVNTKDRFNQVIKMKSAFLVFVCSKIAQAIRTISHLLSKHTFLTITALLVIMIAL